MLINVSDPTFQTILVSLILTGLLFISVKRTQNAGFFSKEVTNQLKGLAILAVVFGHIGYFLSSDNRFLFPLSVASGVGVNIFLFLSGFGLTLSQLKSPLSSLSFYKKRLSKLFIPLWAVITLVLLLDFFLLHRVYPIAEIVHSLLGFYPKANLWQSLDSPLWYFSPILFYYLVFPLLFFKKIPLLSPLLILLLSWLLLNLPLPVKSDVLKLYKLHSLAFPLGMLFALVIPYLKFKLNRIVKILIIGAATLVFLYTAYYSGVGQDPKIEQGISLITTFSAIVIFALSKLEFGLFSIFGIYSYEIYLLHWPIVSRFNPFLGLPPFLDVTLNLGLFILLGYVLQKGIEKIAKQFILT